MVIVFVGIGGFGLGRLSAIERATEPISIVQLNTPNTVQEVVASINGSKYFYGWCSGANNIKDKNIVRFADGKKAEDAGYTLAKNCKGLK